MPLSLRTGNSPIYQAESGAERSFLFLEGKDWFADELCSLGWLYSTSL
jgi:hypothetical protein